MGLFDSFLSDTMLKCPVCGTELGKDLQTKALGQGMSSWRVGDRVESLDVHIERGYVESRVYCQACRRECVFRAVIVDWKFVGIER